MLPGLAWLVLLAFLLVTPGSQAARTTPFNPGHEEVQSVLRASVALSGSSASDSTRALLASGFGAVTNFRHGHARALVAAASPGALAGCGTGSVVPQISC